MKKCLTILIIIFIFFNSIPAQTVTYTHEKNLFYLCKIWGYLKYFHSKVANGDADWDPALTDNMGLVEDAATAESFSTALTNLFYTAGTMTSSGRALPDRTDEMKYNLQLSWLTDNYIPADIKTKLNEVKNKFNLQQNAWVWNQAGLLYFGDDRNYKDNVGMPPRSIRLLGLFRYWNMINYFYPYKNRLNCNWDDVLTEYIPKMMYVTTMPEYHQTMLELFGKINDTNVSTASVTLHQLYGYYYLPLSLKFMDGYTVISAVGSSVTSISPGSILKKMGGTDMSVLRDSIRKYVIGSNDAVLNKNIDTTIIRVRNNVPIDLEIEDQTGTRTVSLPPLLSRNDYLAAFPASNVKWKKITKGNLVYGYINTGLITTDNVPDMFTELWNCDALIFDLRNRTISTLQSLIPYLFPEPVIGAHYKIPDVFYPGTFTLTNTRAMGSGDFTQIYEKKIFLLINEGTRGNGELAVMHLEKNPRAVKIGSITAGAASPATKILMPYKIITSFSSYGVYYPDMTQNPQIWCSPDIEVKPTLQGIREGKDEILEAVFTQSLSAVENDNEMPKQYTLSQNYPNPFNPSTTISFSLPKYAHVTLKIFDSVGREIETLVSNEMSAGKHSIIWNASKYASGVYFYRIYSNNFNETKKLLLLK